MFEFPFGRIVDTGIGKPRLPETFTGFVDLVVPELQRRRRRLCRLAQPVVPRAELDRLSPTGIRLFERMLAESSAGFPDQANKFPDGPI